MRQKIDTKFKLENIQASVEKKRTSMTGVIRCF